MRAALKMKVGDVTAETPVAFDTYRSYGGDRWVAVHALNPDGSDGPWLGTLNAVPWDKWPERFKDAKRGHIKLWEFRPVLKSDQYRLAVRPVGMALGKMGAALALRDHIADRNRG